MVCNGRHNFSCRRRPEDCGSSGAVSQREEFQTRVAHDGRQALELARRHKPNFVILDLMLPVLDGWEVCRQLRQFSDVPILILSAREEEIDRVSGLTLGADDYA